MSTSHTNRKLELLDRTAMLQARRDLPSPADIESFTGQFARFCAKERIAIASTLDFVHQAFRDLPATEALQLLEQATTMCLDEALLVLFAPTIVVSGKQRHIDYQQSWGHWTATVWMYQQKEFDVQLSVDPDDEDVVLIRRSGFSTLQVALSMINVDHQYKYINLATGQLQRHAS